MIPSSSPTRLLSRISALTALFALAWGLLAHAAAADRQIHWTRGLIRKIAPDRSTALIRHEAIPGFMPAMTMELNVRDPRELEGVQTGDTISFRLVTETEAHWIDTIRPVAAPSSEKSIGTATNAIPSNPASPAHPGSPAARALQELEPGDPIPLVPFVTESGRTIDFSEYRGQAVAFTFFFTRCPLPEFCPLMSRNFAKARDLLRTPAPNAATAPTNWMFLSLSFDPDHDTPEVLTRYAQGYRGTDGDRWLFAVASQAALDQLAPRLDLIIQREGGSFSHNLRTVVLDTRGRIHRQFDGNRWKPADLARAMRDAAAVVDSGGGQPSR